MVCTPKPCSPSLQVTGEVTDPSGKVHFVLLGTWDEKMDCFKVQPVVGENGGDARQRSYEAEESRVMLWKRNPLPWVSVCMLPRYLCDLNLGVILMTFLCCFQLHYVRGWAKKVRTFGDITRRWALGDWSCSMPYPKDVQTNQTESANYI